MVRLKDGIRLGEIDEQYDGIVLYDKMRFFHGDGPTCALEAGNQKGGYYFRPGCDIYLCQTDGIACTYQYKINSYAEKQSLILYGKFGKCNSLSSSLEKKLYLKGFKNTFVKKVLRGAKRLPILLLNNPLRDFASLGLVSYEITLI